MESRTLGFYPERQERRKIISLGPQVILEVQELEPQKQLSTLGPAIAKL